MIMANIRYIRAFQRARSALDRRKIATATATAATSRAMSSSFSSTCLSSGANNPLLEPWTAQAFSLPPFDKIQTDHYKPALEVGMEEHLRDLQDIVDNPELPTFENVMIPYDRAGSILGKVGGVFGNMCSSQNTPELQAVQTEMTPILSRHNSATFTLQGLFQKVEQVYRDQQQEQEETNDDDSLTSEDRRLVERIYLDFTRSGAHFDTDKQKENADIGAKLASLITEFSQNGELVRMIVFSI
jgi:peptidyl-dipeptidase Dcp